MCVYTYTYMDFVSNKISYFISFIKQTRIYPEYVFCYMIDARYAKDSCKKEFYKKKAFKNVFVINQETCVKPMQII